MKKYNSILVACAIMATLLFTACPPSNPGGNGSTDTTKVDSVPAGHAYGAAIITLERSVCFGTCPSYTLKIEGNGHVTYEGRDFVAVKGPATADITPDAVKGLVDQFFAIDYFALPDSFDSDITDVPHTITSLSIDGKTKRIFDRDGGPVSLRDLEHQIDVVAQTDKWVKAEEK